MAHLARGQLALSLGHSSKMDHGIRRTAYLHSQMKPKRSGRDQDSHNARAKRSLPVPNRQAASHTMLPLPAKPSSQTLTGRSHHASGHILPSAGMGSIAM